VIAGEAASSLRFDRFVADSTSDPDTAMIAR